MALRSGEIMSTRLPSSAALRANVFSAFVVATSLLGIAAAVPVACAQEAEKSLAQCQKTVLLESKRFDDGLEKALGTCLGKLTADEIKDGSEADAAEALPVCVTQFRKIYDSRAAGKSLPERFHDSVQEDCDPSTNEHTLDDIIGGPGAGVDKPIDAGNLKVWCKNFGGTGDIATIDDWVGCLEKASSCEARQATVSRFPKAMELLRKLEVAIASAESPDSDPTKVSDAETALEETLDSIDSNDDDILDPGCAGFEGVLCPQGTARDFGSNACEPCLEGTHNPNVGGLCVACPAGSVAPNSGAFECTPCPLGTYAASEGSTECSPCDAGSYSAQLGATECAGCPQGTFASDPGSSFCFACPAGMVAATAGSTSCAPCDAGTFTVDGKVCDGCPPGRFSSFPGSASCFTCPPGTFADAAGSTSCQPCDAGSYQSNSGQAVCQSCPRGTAAPDPMSVACVGCGGTTYSDAEGSTSCVECTGSNYSVGTACLPCPVGAICTDGQVVAGMGYWVTNGFGDY